MRFNSAFKLAFQKLRNKGMCTVRVLQYRAERDSTYRYSISPDVNANNCCTLFNSH